VYHNHNVNPFGWDGVEETSAYKTAVSKWKKMKSNGEVEHFDTHSVVMSGLFTRESVHKTCTSAFYLTMPNSGEGLSDREPKCLGGSSSHIFLQMFPPVTSQQPYGWMYYIHKAAFSAVISLHFFLQPHDSHFHAVCCVLIFILLFNFMHLSYLSKIFNQSEEKKCL